MNWTSYASVTAILLSLFTVQYASAYFYSQAPRSRLSSECGQAVCAYNVTVQGNTFPVRYDITNDVGSSNARTANIIKIVADTGKKALVIDLNATHWGVLSLTWPRSLVDATANGGQDSKYIVFVNGRNASDDVTEITQVVNAGEGNRVLSISYSQGQKQIEILGTHGALEFGSEAITLVVMPISVLAVIGITFSYFAKRRLA